MHRPTIRVFVVDESAEVRDRLHRLLDQQPDLRFVGEAGSGPDAARLIEADVPDVAIVDVEMSEDGIELCRHLLSEHPHIKCLVLAGFDDERALIDVLLTGASGLLREHADADDVATAVRAAASGRWVLDPVLQAHPRPAAADEDASALLEQLSDRERQIAQHITRGLSNREIGAQLHLSEKTVRNNISALLAKLSLRNRTQVATMLVQLAAGQRGPGGSVGVRRRPPD